MSDLNKPDSSGISVHCAHPLMYLNVQYDFFGGMQAQKNVNI